MREYLGICVLVWVAVFGAWYLIAGPAKDQAGEGSLSDSGLSAVAYCSDQMDALLAMTDVLLKAGGPEVPTTLRSDVEHCVSFDEKSRSRLGETQLIRLFPRT